MTTVEEIEKAIEGLAPREFDRLRAWFEDYQAARFDEKSHATPAPANLIVWRSRRLMTSARVAPVSCEALREPLLLGCL
jgi:hypothetical protein